MPLHWNPCKEDFWNPCKEDFWNPCKEYFWIPKKDAKMQAKPVGGAFYCSIYAFQMFYTYNSNFQVGMKIQ